MRKQKPSQRKRELRTTLKDLEVRGSSSDMKLGGYAVVFNSPANIGGQFIETIAPGAFTRTLKEDDQILLRDHQSFLLLGRRSAGNLSLRQDSEGVAFEVSLPNTELGRDTYESVRLGLLKGCSMGFFVRDDLWSQDANGTLTRVIKDLQCFEVTLTSMPAYEATSIDLRSIRARLSRSADEDEEDDCNPDSPDYDPDNDCGEERSECDCDCSACADDDCLACSDANCSSESCLANRCGVQERNMHFALITRRLRR